MPENQSAENQNKPGEGGQQSTGDTPTGGEGQEKFKLTQEEFNHQLDERVKRERAKFSDYDDLKSKASRLDEIEEASKSELQKVTDARDALAKERDVAKSEALRFRIASKHGITDDDASLFLTGTDEDTLTKQAERLAGRESDRKKRGNYAPNEGRSSATGSDIDEERDTARQLFGA